MLVVQADSAADAMAIALRHERELDSCEPRLLGLAGEDHVSHAEDEWTSEILEEHLFGRGGRGVAIASPKNLKD